MKTPFKQYKATITINLPLITEEEDPDLAEQEEFDTDEIADHLEEEYRASYPDLPDGLKADLNEGYWVDVEVEKV